MTKRYRKVEHIEPEILELWSKVLEAESVIVELDNPGKAMTMRNRLNAARAIMREESYPGSALMTNYEVALRGNAVLIQVPSWLLATRKALDRLPKSKPMLRAVTPAEEVAAREPEEFDLDKLKARGLLTAKKFLAKKDEASTPSDPIDPSTVIGGPES